MDVVDGTSDVAHTLEQLMFEVFNAMTFQAIPFRRQGIGWMSDFDAMAPQDVRDFYRRWYVPGNAVAVIADDVYVPLVCALA